MSRLTLLRHGDAGEVAEELSSIALRDITQFDLVTALLNALEKIERLEREMAELRNAAGFE